ncbi:MAG: DUF3239 domain-containing protein [Corynebacterium sp.]|nr:DUF3239 domain-containing protein [Corynebacterium sp.]
MRIFEFDVDQDYAKKHNELFRDTRRLQWSAFFFGLIQLLIGWLILEWLGGEIGWIAFGLFALFAILSFAMIVIIPRQVGTVSQVYQTYPLAPAIIAEVNPRDVSLLALVDVSTTGETPKWALAARTVSNLEGHKRAKGERVPVVAVSGRRTVSQHNAWDQATPVPIAWATQDTKVIKDAVRAIPQSEWDMLVRNKDKLSEVRDTRYDLLPLKA